VIKKMYDINQFIDCLTWYAYIWVAVCIGSYLGGYLYLKIKKTNQQDE